MRKENETLSKLKHPLQKRKKVNFGTTCSVILIPSLQEYRNAGIKLWFEYEEYQRAKLDASTEIQQFMEANPTFAFEECVLRLHQPRNILEQYLVRRSLEAEEDNVRVSISSTGSGASTVHETDSLTLSSEEDLILRSNGNVMDKRRYSNSSDYRHGQVHGDTHGDISACGSEACTEGEDLISMDGSVDSVSNMYSIIDEKSDQHSVGSDHDYRGHKGKKKKPFYHMHPLKVRDSVTQLQSVANVDYTADPLGLEIQNTRKKKGSRFPLIFN